MPSEAGVFYHASPQRFDRPTVEGLTQYRVNHDNGALGLWVSTSDTWCKNFGQHLYKLTFAGPTVDLPISTLSRWSQDWDTDYVKLRAEYLAKGITYLVVVEKDGRSEMGIVINLDAITSFDLVSTETKASI